MRIRRSHCASCIVLLYCADDDSTAVIADFGFAKKTEEPDSLRTELGTLQYMAPEVLNGFLYDWLADMWSLGVTLCLLLTAEQPLPTDGKMKLMRAIRNGKISLDGKPWSKVSPEAKDLVRRLLVVDPKKRLSAQAALSSPWITALEKSLPSKPLHNVSSSFRAAAEIRPQNVEFSVNGDERKHSIPFDQRYESALEVVFGGTFSGWSKGTGDEQCTHQISWFKGTESDTNEPVCFKRVELLNPLQALAFESERSAWEAVRGKLNVATLRGVFYGPDTTDRYIVVEALCCVPLNTRVGQFTQGRGLVLFKGVLQATEQCHAEKVAIRSFTLDSFMCFEKDGVTNVKLFDLSTAKLVPREDGLRTLCGRAGYTAPEVLEGSPAYDHRCDMWSAGVCLYTMLFGKQPFENDHVNTLYQVLNLDTLTENLERLVNGMINPSRIDRLTATRALELLAQCD